ncbi:MAG: FeoB-associated Cys-rich membrane protein [Verrucomicrobiaceae bacterium]|nr:FeoB-associated Cys-rich membrane protein [Verrucomicrobiaceae bacterium]
MDWQTLTALAIVILTAVIFIVRAVKNRRKSGCGSGGCGGGCPK